MSTSSPAGEQRGGDVRAEAKWEIRDHRINEKIKKQVSFSLGTTCRFESVTVLVMSQGFATGAQMSSSETLLDRLKYP
jgi:hypothetical protein